MNISNVLTIFNAKIGSLIGNFVSYLPNIGFALVLILIGVSLAFLIRFLVKNLIISIKNTLLGHWLKRWMFDLENLAWWIGIFVFWTIILFTLTLTSEVLDLKIISRWFTEIAVYLPKLLLCGLFFTIGIILGKPIKEKLIFILKETGIATPEPMGILAQYTVIFIFTLIGIAQMDINVWFVFAVILVILSAILGGFMLALGLGAQVMISNFLSTYHLQKKLHVGQTIKIGDQSGKIIKITATSINMETEEGMVILPGKIFANNYCLVYKGRK